MPHSKPGSAISRTIGKTFALGLLLGLAGCSFYHQLPLTPDAVEAKLRTPGEKALVIAAGEIKHPLLKPVRLDARNGLSPDEAAVLAVVLNPELRAVRVQRQTAQAQLLQAGILPNPQLSGNLDYVTNNIAPAFVTATGYGLSWDIRSLLTLGPNITAAKANLQSVRLDIAWLEWQTALAARSSLYALAALLAQVAQAEEIYDRLSRNAALMKKAEEAHEKTIVDFSAAVTSANTAQAILLSLRHDLAQRRITLNRTIGFPSGTRLRVQSDVVLPTRVDPPSEAALLSGLEDRRLDLLALKRGYESQDARLRSAIIAQFPRINIGFARASDTSSLQTIGPNATVDLPIFNRNQGNVAIENATRQRLFEEYTNRLFQARTDIASALASIHWLNTQIAASERALLALRQLVEVSQGALQQGNADVLAFYAAQNSLTQKVISTLNLKQQLAASRVALETAAGWYLPP